MRYLHSLRHLALLGLILLSLPVRSDVLLVLGDSLSAGYGIPTEKGWVALLQKRLETEHPQIEVINASISGETTHGGLRRLPDLLSQHQPRWLLLELGANDGLRGQPLPGLRARLQQLIEQAQQSGAEVGLLGIALPTNYGQRYTEAFQAIYPELAQHYRLPFHPFFLDGVALNPTLMQADGLHPTSDAQPQLLENIWPVVQQLLERASS